MSLIIFLLLESHQTKSHVWGKCEFYRTKACNLGRTGDFEKRKARAATPTVKGAAALAFL
jgi:hypothetical protein